MCSSVIKLVIICKWVRYFSQIPDEWNSKLQFYKLKNINIQLIRGYNINKLTYCLLSSNIYPLTKSCKIEEWTFIQQVWTKITNAKLERMPRPLTDCNRQTDRPKDSTVILHPPGSASGGWGGWTINPSYFKRILQIQKTL